MSSSKWALVTGASVEIGESFTRLLAKQGYNIALVARDEVRLHERADSLREKFGVQTFVLVADLATDAGCKVVEDYISTYPIEVLINNAGGGIFEHVPIAQFDPPFEEYFATPQSVDFALLCGAHGVSHHQVRSLSQLRKLTAKLPAKGIRLLEVATNRELDAATRKRLFTQVAASLA